MLKKRIIPCLDIRDGRTVKGINFENIRDAGDPVELARRYVDEGADELVFLDITATVDKRKTLVDLVERIAAVINIPFTVGGGINSVEDARAVIKAGADKVTINSAALRRPELISEIAGQFGSQCVVVSIDTKLIAGSWDVFIDGGRTRTIRPALEWAKEVEQLGAGEILLTSMNNDGTKEGFAVELYNDLCKIMRIPVIASGGAGKMEDFVDLFKNSGANAALAASIFHYGEVPISNLKKELYNNRIAVRR